MSNLAYCRFRNTLDDLRDCLDNLWEPIEDKDERRARAALIRVCEQIVNEDFEDNDALVDGHD